MRTGEERPPAPGAAERVLYSDEHCLVVNKIAGESAEPLCGAGASTPAAGVSMPAGGQVDLPALLRDRFGPLTAVHRLDVPVSGCVLFARTARALSFLGAAFASGAPEGVEKRYWAITALPRGDLPETGELVHWIGRGGRGIDAGGKSIDAGGRGIDAGGGNKSVAFDEPGPGRKQGILRYRVRGRGDRYLFLEIDLVTGRHHQIR
ncbi:MAG: RNA pseudouridine synthase, partial [Treponema sp.]|nr:RNA pseudouridine synthase [Treponema sp.]